MTKTWYKVIYDGGQVKDKTQEDVVRSLNNPSFGSRVKRVVKVTEQDIDIEYIKETW